MFAQPFDHSFNDLFNQYVNMDSSGADGKDTSFSTDFDQLFPLDSLSSDCGDLSPTVSTSKRHHQSPQPWTKDWSLQDSSVSEQVAFQDTVHPSAISDRGLNNFEVSSRPTITQTLSSGHPSASPSTPPATPQRKANKSALVTPKSIRHRDPHERRALLRKQSSSPSLMRSSIHKGRMAYPEAWAQRIQNFTLASSDDRLPLSPPPSDVLIQHESMSADTTALNHPRDSAEMPPQYDARLFHQSPAVSMPSPSATALARNQQQYMSHPSSSALTNSSPPSADDIFSSSHSSDPQSISSWQSDALCTSLSFTPDLQGHDAQWWSPMPSRVAQQQTNYQTMVNSPAPQRSMQSVGSQDMMHGGLMIQLDPSFDMSGDSSLSSNMLSTNNQKFVAPFTAPHLHNTSRSPSLSPKAGTSPKDTRNGIAKGTHRRTHSRKLSGQSMTGPKPAKSSTSPRGSNKSVSVSFVNFTANDSQKILTGVAPSGSSKTKARREQEARDRRRKLSEAALLAVRNAGGDVEALEAVLC
ncbi:hypothetical protein N7462_007858 [Penicillium macrosclerotiorum]|uniref:uncharacterized protein n=1 Tax=Penicillium macrosclerotiorum TaxID=303699 RepID=UPI00254846BB|nr:uncharacterized protein N7462_007858 [Penicillium macrosclerotiorum]KAJ5679614.1 hypothetical protein N7462_007858 [Penicillium macrosclerotiorum]